jgi:hypothetical protein
MPSTALSKQLVSYSVFGFVLLALLSYPVGDTPKLRPVGLRSNRSRLVGLAPLLFSIKPSSSTIQMHRPLPRKQSLLTLSNFPALATPL